MFSTRVRGGKAFAAEQKIFNSKNSKNYCSRLKQSTKKIR